jgi:hypothetical protein
MDTSLYPGDAVMVGLRKKTNLVWTGFYLGPAPSHPDASWMNKRQALIGQGWGLAPIYVGQQLTGPGSHFVHGKQGTVDGKDACKLAAKAGFPAGTVLYLDVETGGPLSAEARDYLVAWCEPLRDAGYVPGIYCSYTSAASALEVASDLVLWIFRLKNSDVGVIKKPPFSEKSVEDSGIAAATAWQWAQDCRIDVLGKALLVDLDVASSVDPSRTAGIAFAPKQDAAAWAPGPDPDGDEMVHEVDPRIDASHIERALPCPSNPGPPPGWSYWKGSVPHDCVALAVSMQADRVQFPMGTFARKRIDGDVVGFRVEWHAVQAMTGKRGAFRGVNLMRRDGATGRH